VLKSNKSMKSMDINSTNPIWIFVKGIISAYIFVLFIFLIMALLITYTNIPEALIPMLSSITLIISISISGMYVGSKLRRKGWFNGGIEGIVYIVLLIAVSWAFMDDFSLDRYVLYKSVVGVLSGGIGGMIGVNLK